MYEYRIANIVRVIDGDTLDLDLDLGFYAVLRVRVRLAGIDTYEIYGKNAHEKGALARDFAVHWLEEREGQLTITTQKLRPDTPVADGSFGRWMGDIRDADGASLTDALREADFEDV